MYFSIAEQEVDIKGAKLRFEVDRSDTSRVVFTLNFDGRDQVRATFQRNGYPLSVEEIEPPQEAEDGEVGQNNEPAPGAVEQVPVSGGAPSEGT